MNADHAKIRASRFLGTGSGEEENNREEHDGSSVILPLAGSHNSEELSRLRSFLTQEDDYTSTTTTTSKAPVCACVEGPALSGKSRCCENAFRVACAHVDRWEDLSCGRHKGAAPPTVGVDAYMLKDRRKDEDDSRPGQPLPRVLFVDNLHVLIKEDKNSFQNLLKCIRSASSAADKCSTSSSYGKRRRNARRNNNREEKEAPVRPHIKKVVITLDPEKLDPRIYSRLCDATIRMFRIRMVYPTRAETAAFLKQVLQIETDVTPFLKEGKSVRDGVSRTLRALESSKENEGTGDRSEREEEEDVDDVGRSAQTETDKNTTVIDVLSSLDLDLNDPFTSSFVPSLSSALSASCVLDGCFEASRAQSIDTGHCILHTAYKFGKRLQHDNPFARV